jgi:hypothetical protein
LPGAPGSLVSIPPSAWGRCRQGNRTWAISQDEDLISDRAFES